MANPILLPRQGQSVESCIITEFYVAVGDTVSAGTPLFAYETDKASFEEEAREDGTILAIFFEAGDEVPVLTKVGVIGKQGESFEEFLPGGSVNVAKEKNVKNEPVVSKGEEKMRETLPEPEQKAFLIAMLEPTATLKKYEENGQNFERLALLEELKTKPFGAVWDYYCLKEGVPVGEAYIEEVQRYESEELLTR